MRQVGESPDSDPRATERGLVDRLRQGDEDAFERLVSTHAGKMLAVARRILRNDEDARDAVQDAFVSAFRSIERFSGTAKLSTWLHRIVVNAALMRLRSAQRRPEEPIDDLLPRFLSDGHHAAPPSAWAADSAELLARRETRRQVRRSIDRLPAQYRIVLLLRDIEGLSTEETAEMLGITANAAKVRLHRARQALRTLLDDELRGTEP